MAPPGPPLLHRNDRLGFGASLERSYPSARSGGRRYEKFRIDKERALGFAPRVRCRLGRRLRLRVVMVVLAVGKGSVAPDAFDVDGKGSCHSPRSARNPQLGVKAL